MKLRLFVLTFATVTFLAAQTPPQPAKPPASGGVGPFLTPSAPPRETAPPPATPIAPDTVVVTVNGKGYTAREMDDMTKMLPAQVKTSLWQKPEQGVTQLFLLKVLSDEAKKRKLNEVEATKEALDSRDRLYLANTMVQEHNQNIHITDAEEEAYYQAHKEDFESVKISAIYIAFTPNPKPGTDGKMPRTEAEAKAKAEDLVKGLRAGADFAKIAADSSDDKDSAKKGGELTTIKRTDKYPQPIKDAVFKLKDGEISDPVKQPAGYYILKPTSRTVASLAEVKESIFQRMRQEKFNDWMKAMQKEYTPVIEKPEYFSGPKPAPAPSLASPGPLPPPASAPVTPDTVVATVAGKPYTAKQIDEMLKVLSPQQKGALKQNPQAGLGQLFMIMQLSDEARKQGLDQQSPNKEMLELTERQELANAYVNSERTGMTVTKEDEEAYYKSHLDRYELYKVSAIMVSFSNAPKSPVPTLTPSARTENEAKTRAEELVKQLRAGADFAKVAKESSDDKSSSDKGGEYATLRATDTNTPADVRKAVFALKQGEVSDPVKQGGGFYIFKMTSRTAETLAQAAPGIEPAVKQEKFTQWFAGVQKQYAAQIQRPDYFTK